MDTSRCEPNLSGSLCGFQFARFRWLSWRWTRKSVFSSFCTAFRPVLKYVSPSSHHSDNPMQYPHMPRDQNLDSNGSVRPCSFSSSTPSLSFPRPLFRRTRASARRSATTSPRPLHSTLAAAPMLIVIPPRPHRRLTSPMQGRRAIRALPSPFRVTRHHLPSNASRWTSR